MSKESEDIEGVLERVVFKNDNGFMIGAFIDKHNNKFTALGSMINPQVDMEYIFSGEWISSPKFGDQFKFSSYETIVPVDTSGIFKYIVRICNFVGPSVGNAIIDRYGEKTLSIMKDHPEKLSNEIKGITMSRAKEIQSTLLENEKIEKLMIELGVILDIPGMRKSLQQDLIKAYKSNAIEIVKDNPYILTEFNGVGFPLADRVALKIGFARDSIKRKEAVVIHCLKTNMQEGSIWIKEKDLHLRINELIQVPDLNAGIESLFIEEIIVHKNDCFALSGPAEDEKFISETVAKMGVL